LQFRFHGFEGLIKWELSWVRWLKLVITAHRRLKQVSLKPLCPIIARPCLKEKERQKGLQLQCKRHSEIEMPLLPGLLRSRGL
jgi:hypothetical protein